MDAVPLLSALYACSGLAACGFYAPQILRLARDVAARRAMSLTTWGGWLAVSMVSLAYAAVVAGQPEMVAVAAANTLCQMVVVTLVAVQRCRDRTCERAGRPSAPAR